MGEKKMTQFAKIKITGIIELQTGLHIGTNNAFAAIGAIDSPIIKDAITSLPIIPGSSLKGKMRSLLARAYNDGVRQKASGDTETIKRLFGDSESKEFKMGNLIFRDAFLNKEKLDQKGASTPTETKFENTIDRITAEANPRQIERAIRGSEFNFELIYELNENSNLEEDFEVIKNGLKLLQLDYLGGSGSRGYGKVKFKDLQAKAVFGGFDTKDLDKILQEINNEAL